MKYKKLIFGVVFTVLLILLFNYRGSDMHRMLSSELERANMKKN